MTGVPHFRQRDSSEQAWRRQGLCWGMDPDLWYPARGVNGDAAIAVCRTCPVRAECLEWALTNGETEFGIWGGVPAIQRRRIRAARRRQGRAA